MHPVGSERTEVAFLSRVWPHSLLSLCRRCRTLPPFNYLELRQVSQSVYAKLFSGITTARRETVHAARRLGLPTPGDVIVLGGDSDSAALSDFLLAEVRFNGKTLIETLDPAALQLTGLALVYFEAFRRARTSLFMTDGAEPERHEVVLRDLLEPDRAEFRLTDIGLSKSLAHMPGDLLVFTRVLELEGLCLSSGMSLGFHAAHRDSLLQSFRQKMKKVAPADHHEQKFIFFYRKHRELGIAQGFADAEPPAES